MKDEVLMISRSGTSKLLDKGFQEQFYEAIKSRKRDDSLQLDVRKLREAIVATGRNDKFAVDVYEYSVDLAISSGNFQELIKSLSYLHSFLYDNAVDYPRKAEIIAYYLYYLTCYTVSENKLTGSTIEVLKVYQKYPALTDERVIVQAIDWLRALNLDVDYVGLQNVWKNTSTSERIIIQTMFPRLRVRLSKLISKSYFTIPLEFFLQNLFIDSNSPDWKEVVRILTDQEVTSETISLELKKRSKK